MIRRPAPSTRSRLALSSALGGALLLGVPAAAQLPTVDSIIARQPDAAAAVITFPEDAVRVGLTQRRVIIDWTDFSVPVDSEASFRDDRADGVRGTNSMAVLNRVLGVEGVVPQTRIEGRLVSDANIAVFIYNPTGVLFGADAVVDVGGLLATAIAPTNLGTEGGFLDEASNEFRFADPLATGAVVVEPGASLTTASEFAQAGVVLIGARVESRGTITAEGDVGLVAATDVNISWDRASPLSMTIADGTPLDSPIVAEGTVGGRNVVFAAATRATVVDAVLDIAAVTTATAAEVTDRGIVLVAGDTGIAAPGVAFTGLPGGVIDLDLGANLTATGLGGSISVLATGRIAGAAADLDATQAAFVRANLGGITLGDVVSGGAAGTTLLALAGDISAGVLDATGGDLALTSTLGDLGFEGGSVGGAVTLSAVAGTIDVTAALDADGAVNAAATAVDLAEVDAGSLDVTTSLGVLSIGAGGATSTIGGLATLDSAASLTVRGTLAADGDATLDAVTSFTGGTVTSDGDLAVTALGGIDAASLVGGTSLAVEGGSITLGSAGATAGSALLTSTAGDVTLDTATVDSDLTIDAAGTVGVAGTATIGGDYIIFADAVTLGDGATVTQAADGAVEVNARSGDIIGSAGLTLRANADGTGGESLILDADGAITFAATSLLAGGLARQSDVAVRLATPGTVLTLGRVEARALGVTDAAHVAFGPLANDASIRLRGAVSVIDTLEITASQGDIEATSIAVTGAGETLRLRTEAAGGDITATGTLAGRDGLIIEAARDATFAGLAAADGDVDVTADRAAVVTGTVDAGGDYVISADSVALGSGGAAVQAADGTVDITATTGAITGSAGLTLRANDDGSGTERLVLDATGGTIDFAATSLLSGGDDRQSDVAVRLGTPGTVLTLGRVEARALGVTDAARTAFGPLVNGAAIRLRGAVSLVDSLTVETSDGVIETAAVGVTGAAGTLTLRTLAADDITATGTLRATAGVLVASGEDARLAGLASSAGDVTVTAPGLASVDGTVDAAGAYRVTGGTVDLAGVQSADGLVEIVTTASDLVAQAGLTLTSDADSDGAGDLILRASGAIDFAGQTLRGGASGLAAIRVGAGAGESLTLGTVEARLLASYEPTLTATALDHGGAVRIDSVSTSESFIVGSGSIRPASLTLGSATSTTGDVILNVAGGLAGTAATGADLAASTIGRDVVVTTDAGARLNDITAGRDVIVTAAGAAAVTGDVAARRDYRVTGSSVTLGGDGTAAQGAFGEVDIVSTGGALTGLAGLTLTSDTDGSAGGDLLLRSAAGIAFGPATLRGGSAPSAAVRVGLPSGAALVLGDVVAARLASYEPTRTAIALDHPGEVTLGAVDTALDLVVGSTPAGRPANLTLTSATTPGDISLNVVGTLGGPAGGRATLSAGGDIVTRSAVARLGAVTAGGNIDLAATGLLDVTSIAGGADVTLLSGGALRADAFTAIGDLSLTAAEITGSAGAPERANLTSSGGAVTATADGLALLGTVTAATTVAVTGRIVDIASATALGGGLAIVARELESFDEVSLALALGRATGDVVLSVGLGSGDTPTPANGSARLGDVASSGGTLSVTAADGDITGFGSAGAILAAATDLVVIGGGLVRLGDATADGDVTVRAGDALVPTRDGRIEISRTSAGGSLRLEAFNDAAGTPAGIALGEGLAGGDARLRTLGTRGDIAVTTLDAASATLDSAGSVDAADLDIGGQLTVVSAGATRLATIEAGSLFADAATTLDFTTLTIVGDATLRAGGSLTGDTLTAASIDIAGGAVDVDALEATTTVQVGSPGAVTLGTAIGTTIELEAGTTLSFTTVSATGGDANLTAAGALTGATLTATGNVMASGGSIALDTAAADATLTLDSTGATTLGAAIGAAVTLTAGTTLDFSTVTATAGDATLTAGDALTGDTLTATGAITVDAGSIAIDVVDAGASLTLDSAGAMTLGTATGATLALTAGTTLDFSTVTATGGDATLTAGDALTGDTLTATGSITVDAGSIAIDVVDAGATLTLDSAGAMTLGTATGATVTLAAGTTLDFTTVTATAGDATLTAGDALTGDTLTATGSITVDAGSIAIDVIDAGGTLSFTTAGAIVLDTVDAGDDVILSAGTTFDFVVITTAGNATLSAGGALDGGTLDAAGDATVDAGSITLDTVEAGGALALTAAGPIALGAGTGGTVAVVAGTTLDFASIAATAGDANLDAGALTGTTLTAVASITAEAGSIALETATAGGALVLRGLDSTRVTTATGGTLDLAAGTTLDFATATALDGDATLAAGGALTGTTLVAAGSITADAGSIDLDAVTAGAALTLDSVGATTLGTATAATVALAAGTTLDFTAVTAAGGDATLSAGGALTGGALTAAANVTTGADTIALETTTAGAALALTSLASTALGTATGATVDVAAGTTLNFTTVAATSGDAALTAGDALTGATLTATGAVAGTAGTITLDTVTAGAALTLSSAGATTLGAATGATVGIAAGTTLDFTTLTATVGGAALTAADALTGGVLEAAGAIDVDAGSVDLATTIGGAAVDITAENSVMLGDLVTAGDLAISAGTTLGFATIAGEGGATLTAGGAVNGGVLGAAGLISIAADGITIDTTTGGRTLAMTSRGAITLGEAEASGAIVLTAATDTVFDRVASLDGGVTVTAGGLVDGTTLAAADAIVVDAGSIDLDATMAGGDIDLAAATTLRFGTVDAGGDVTARAAQGLLSGDTLVAAGAADLSGVGILIGTVTAGGRADLASAADLDVTTLDAGGDARLDATGAIRFEAITAGGGAALDAGGAIVGRTLTAGGRIDATGAFIALGTGVAGAGARLASLADIDLGTLTADADLLLEAGAAIRFTSVRSVTGSARLLAGGVVDGDRLEAATGINVGAAAIDLRETQSGGAATLASTGSTTLGTLTATDDVTLTAGSLDAGSLQSTAGGFGATVDGAATIARVAAARDLALDAGSFAIGDAIAGGVLTLVAAGDGSLTLGEAGAGVRIDTGGALTFGALRSLAADIDLAAGAAITGTLLDAATDARIAANAIDLATASTGGDLATISAADTRLGAATTGGDARLTAGGRLAATTLNVGGALIADAATIDVDTADIGATATLTSSGDTRLGTVRAGGDAQLTAGGSLAWSRLAAGQLTALAFGAIDGTDTEAAGAATIDAADTSLGTLRAGTTLDIAVANNLSLTDGAAGGDATLDAGLIDIGALASGGALAATAASDITAVALTAAGPLTLVAGGVATIGTARAGGPLSVEATRLELGTGDASAATLALGDGGAAVGSLTTSGDITLDSGGGVGIGTARSAAGAITANVTADLVAETLGAGGAITVDAGTFDITDGDAGTTLALSAAGDGRLGAGRATGDLGVTAGGVATLDGAMQAGGDLVVEAATVDLATGGGAARQAAGGRVLVTATGGAVRGGGGLVLTAAGGGSGAALVISALGGNGALDFGATSRIGDGALTEARLEATGLARLGEVSATRAIEVRGGDAELQSAVRAPEVRLVNTRAGAPMRLGDLPAGDSAEFAGQPAARFDLATAEVNRVEAATLRLDAVDRNIVIGDLAIGAAAGATRLDLRTTGRLDILGRLSLALAQQGRDATLGGDGGDLRASVIRLATTPEAGGRLLADGADVTLAGDRIAAGYDANLLGPLGLIGSSTPLGTAEVATQFVSLPGSALYSATAQGSRPYTQPLLVRAGSLTVRYGSYALFQNTGQPGQNSGVELGSAGGGLALRVVAEGGQPNAFALYGTINGFANAATSLLGPDQLTLAGPVSRQNARANGCVIGSAGGGCLASSLAQPGLIVFETRAEIFRASDQLTVPFEPLVGTSNEALFSDIAGVDLDGGGAGVPFDGMIGSANEALFSDVSAKDKAARDGCAPDDVDCKAEDKR